MTNYYTTTQEKIDRLKNKLKTNKTGRAYITVWKNKSTDNRYYKDSYRFKLNMNENEDLYYYDDDNKYLVVSHEFWGIIENN